MRIYWGSGEDCPHCWYLRGSRIDVVHTTIYDPRLFSASGKKNRAGAGILYREAHSQLPKLHARQIKRSPALFYYFFLSSALAKKAWYSLFLDCAILADLLLIFKFKTGERKGETPTEHREKQTVSAFFLSILYSVPKRSHCCFCTCISCKRSASHAFANEKAQAFALCAKMVGHTFFPGYHPCRTDLTQMESGYT